MAPKQWEQDKACYKCGKEGHIKRDCPSLKNKPKKKIHKAKNVMCEDEDESSESYLSDESSFRSGERSGLLCRNRVSFCEGCVEGKLTKKPFKSIGEIRSKRKMQLIYSDVCGPMQTESISGAKYFVTFIDDYSRCCKVYFMKQKNEVLCKFKKFEKTFTNECGLTSRG